MRGMASSMCWRKSSTRDPFIRERPRKAPGREIVRATRGGSVHGQRHPAESEPYFESVQYQEDWYPLWDRPEDRGRWSLSRLHVKPTQKYEDLRSGSRGRSGVFLRDGTEELRKAS